MLVVEMVQHALDYATYKFTVRAHESETVSVWLFNLDARVTGTHVSEKSPGKAIVKVMYRMDGDEEECISVTNEKYEELVTTLRRNHELSGSETMGAWSASFLERFER